MNISNLAQSLIELNTKVWLCDRLGITRVTLDNRLKYGNWKKLEIEKLLKLR